MKKEGNKRYLYLGTLILFILVISNLVAAEETIVVDYPGSVELGEEFVLSLELVDFEADSYDVKFEIKNGSRNIAQRLVEDEWKSTHYWIYNGIDSTVSTNKDFRLKIIEEFDGIIEIVIKIKDGTINEFEGYSIIVTNEAETDDPIQDDNNNQSNEIDNIPFIDMDWVKEEIINGQEFEIDIEAIDLDDRMYNIKVWIEKESESVIISERYDEEEDEWKSGNYYVKDLIRGPGEDDDKILIRIKDSYRNYDGDARIFIRTNDARIETIEYDIEILEEDNNDNTNTVTTKTNNNEIKDTSKMSEEEYLKYIIEAAKEYDKEHGINGDYSKSNVIRLGKTTKTIETENIKRENSLVYESSESVIKRYAIISFAFLTVALTVLLVFNKLK